MKYILTNVLSGVTVEIIYGDKVKFLSPSEPSITLTEEEYRKIAPSKKYLIESGFIKVIEIEEVKKELKKGKAEK